MNSLMLLLVYALAVNVLGLLLMRIDKWKARLHAFRIPELTLWVIAVIGGSIGIIAGMFLFRHKNKKRAFRIGMPVLLAVQVAALCYLFFFLPVEIRFM